MIKSFSQQTLKSACYKFNNNNETKKSTTKIQINFIAKLFKLKKEKNTENEQLNLLYLWKFIYYHKFSH